MAPSRVGGNLPSCGPILTLRKERDSERRRVVRARPRVFCVKCTNSADGFSCFTPTPPGNLYRCESKGVAGKAIRKTMKTKGAQNAMVVRDAKSRANSEGLTCGNMWQGTT